MHTPMHEFENKLPLLAKLEQNDDEENNFDSGYESKLKNHKSTMKPSNFSSITTTTGESNNKISSENLLHFSSNTSSSGLNTNDTNINNKNVNKNNNNNNILLHSPLSSTSQSSGFGGATSSSIHTALTAATSSPSEFEWSGSGSGAGFPQCVQRTIARQIKLFYPCIGKGRFGEVYKGEWRGEHVAVKTFNSADEKSWENECNIYNTNGFRHESILGFIAADNIDRGTYTELWLITEFHENGSLFDYLTANTITPLQALNMCLSIVNGLVHLHMPIESCKGKPALAHCDLKSKNILVKANLTCCIGDLGLALSGDKDGKIMHASNVRTGTKRYMAPEILSKRIEIKFLDAFQKAEMYSLGLVFWELLRRCKFEDESTQTLYTFEYKPPYYEFITGDPDENLMRQIVCEQNHRPILNPLWRQNPIMNELVRLTEELWVEMPNERLNALRLKKSITKIKTNFLENQKSNIV
jgi:TGF-beta receptor type-1